MTGDRVHRLQAEVGVDRLLEVSYRFQTGMELLCITRFDEHVAVREVEPREHHQTAVGPFELDHDRVGGGGEQCDVGILEIMGQGLVGPLEAGVRLSPSLGADGVGRRQPEGHHGGIGNFGVGGHRSRVVVHRRVAAANQCEHHQAPTPRPLNQRLDHSSKIMQHNSLR